MGYTHYWEETKDISVEDWGKITKTLKRMIDIKTAEGIDFCDGSGELFAMPEINDTYFSLNGADELAHESFYVQRTGSDAFEFCKTAMKPYDVIVVATLTIIDDLGYTTLSSDGDEDDLEEGIEFGRKIFKEVNGDTISLEPAKSVKELIEDDTVKLRERIVFDDIDNPDSGFLVWHYGAIFCIMDRNFTEIDTFNINEAIDDMDRAHIEAQKHFESVRSCLSS